MKNVTKHTDIKLVTANRKSHLVPETNYHTSRCFSENLLTIETE